MDLGYDSPVKRASPASFEIKAVETQSTYAMAKDVTGQVLRDRSGKVRSGNGVKIFLSLGTGQIKRSKI